MESISRIAVAIVAQATRTALPEKATSWV